MQPEVFVHRSVMPASAAALFRWHERPEALTDLLPKSRFVRVKRRTGDLRDGGRVEIAMGVGPLRLTWTALHFGYVEGVQFCDEQVAGPFRLWRHTHRVEPLGQTTSLLEDRVEFVLPGGPVVHGIGRALCRRLLAGAFAQRHAITRASLRQAGGVVQLTRMA